MWRRWSASNAPWSTSGRGGFSPSASPDGTTLLAAAPRAVFPPEVAIHVVRLACECPDRLGRSRSPWDGHELARQLIAETIVEDISASTVRRMLVAHYLKPWRHVGVLMSACALVRGKIEQRFGGGWASLWKPGLSNSGD
jgi:hypothetical protein